MVPRPTSLTTLLVAAGGSKGAAGGDRDISVAAPALALGADPAEDGLMRQPPRPHDEGVITARMWRGIFLVGAVMAGGTLFVLDAAMPAGSSKARALAVGRDRWSRTMIPQWQAGSTWRSAERNSGTLPVGSITKNRITAAESKLMS